MTEQERPRTWPQPDAPHNPTTAASQLVLVIYPDIQGRQHLSNLLYHVEEAARRQQAVDLRTLLDAIETMDQKITPYGEREDGTILHYIVADSTWHRVLSAARNPRWAGTSDEEPAA